MVRAVRNDGGPAFPEIESSLMRDHSREPGRFTHDYKTAGGMSLRDWFATIIDKDEYGDIISRNLTRETGILLAGPYPEEPRDLDAKYRVTPEQRIAWRIACLAWEFRVRAALRYMMADAMLAERDK